MAAVSGIVNPLNPDEILLFFCNTDKQVGLSIHKDDDNTGGTPVKGTRPKGRNLIDDELPLGKPFIGADDRPRRGAAIADPPVTTGVIRNPSSFGSAQFRNLVRVYGWRVDGTLCLISPAFTPVKSAPKTEANSLASAWYSAGPDDSSKDAGWLYYISTKDDPPKIYEYPLAVGAEVGIQAAGPIAETNLCAYYDPNTERRYCIYQNSTNYLACADITEGSSPTIKNTGSAKAKTPLACCLLGDNAYLYYSDGQGILTKAVRTKKGWQASATVDKAPPLKDGTKLSCVAAPDGSAIFVFYLLASSTEGFYKYKDDDLTA